MILALETQETTLWQVSLVVGAVVIAVVIALLALLLSFVGSIDTGVQALLVAGGTVAVNTGNIKTALTVADTLDEVAAEAGRHAQLLGLGA